MGVALTGAWTCGSGISRNMDLWEWHVLRRDYLYCGCGSYTELARQNKELLSEVQGLHVGAELKETEHMDTVNRLAQEMQQLKVACMPTVKLADFNKDQQ